MSMPNQIKFTCRYCDKKCSRKESHYLLYKNHYCSNKCRYLGRTKDIDNKKEEILKLYNSGKTMFQISKELKFQYPRLAYHFHKWGIEVKRCYMYQKIMDTIGEKRRNKTDEKFLERYRNGEIEWRHTHDLASRNWKITEKPCEVCGWKEAERDMHLIKPRVLIKNNAVSLCPNCHRLFHRGKIKIIRKNRKIILVKI